MMLSILRKPWVWMLLAALLFCAACGGSDNDDDDASEGSGPPSSDDDDDNDDDNDDDDNDDDDDDDDDDNDDDDDDDDDDDNDNNDDDNDDDDNDDDDNDNDNDSSVLLDETGRQILLRGANAMGMEFGWFNHQPEDFARMAGWGFNVVRLPIAWAYLEPEPGVWDEDYLTNVVEPVVGMADDAGLRVILDMHQWQWCGPCGGNGIPEWMCQDFADLPNPWDYLLEATYFWSQSAWIDDFVAAWQLVSAHFAGDNRIWAYDLFNEPNAGFLSLPWTSENSLYRPMFVRMIDAIRANHPEPYILIEPTITNVVGLPFVMDPLPYERLLYEPHLYPFGVANGQPYDYSPDVLRWFMDKNVNDAAKFGTPLLVGETGIVSSADGAEDFARDNAQVLDEYVAHYTWWCYWKDDSSFGLLNADGSDKEIFVRYLNRPYPRAVMGRIEALDFDVDDAVFALSFRNVAGQPPDARVFVPTARHFTGGFTVESTDPEGAWSWTWDEAAQELSIVADPASATHVVTVRAARAAAGEP